MKGKVINKYMIVHNNTKYDNIYTCKSASIVDHLYRKGKENMIEFLVELEKIDVNCATADGQTPLDLVQSPKHIQLLLKYGAAPTYQLYDDYYPHRLRKPPADMSIKVFVLGNSGAGKSTLIESLKREGSRSKVKSINKMTAGIIPHDLNSDSFNLGNFKVTLYDFAGHKNFHSSHVSFLSHSMANSPSIVILVVDVRDEDHQFKGAVLYWLEFISQCFDDGPKPHLVLICSHADQVKKFNAKSKLQLALSIIEPYKFDLICQVLINCQNAKSPSMSELCPALAQRCQTMHMQSSQSIAIEHHCFLVFLLDKFKDKIAITLGEAKSKVKAEAYFKFLKSHNLLEICEQLNKRDNILFMKNYRNPDNSWIILDKITLLTKVFGVLFAPKEFKEHQNIATSTGVVPLSKLTSLFPDLNPDMLTQFLCNLEFCEDTADSKLLNLLPADDILNQLEENERFYFFPGLVRDVLPQDLWLPNDDLGYDLGWAVECSKPEQFLTTRFLQILLLRLAFQFADAPAETSTIGHPALQRICKIWKNGISWANVYGGEAVVEIANQKQVVVVTRCSKGHELESGRLLSAIIRKVLETKNEHCPNVFLTESVILSGDVAHYNYPLDLTKVTTISITDVAKLIKSNEKVLMHESKIIEVEKFLYFEPYMNLGEKIIWGLMDKENPDHYQEITEEFIYHIAEQMHSKAGSYIAIFKQAVQLYPSPGNFKLNLVQELQGWKIEMGSKASRCNLHKQLDQFSVFSGRNPLKVAAGTVMFTIQHTLLLY